MLKRILGCLQQIKSNPTFLKMAESLPISLGKRPAETDSTDSGTEVHKKKKKKQNVQLGKSEGCKRKIAMLVAYNGAGYYGVQVRLVMGAKFCTDKLLNEAVLVPDLVKKLNEVLPAKIRVIGYVRTTNGFDSKNWCDSRTYMYMLPTFAFAPLTKFVTEDYRSTPDIQTRVRAVLSKFVGTHKFHNFTSGVKYEQACASRYIIKFECSEPYIREGIEFVTLRVKGQSFMLHHIRKMIGLTIAILRGYCGESTIESSWGPEKVDIPKAPGLGLVLETLHVDGYNKKFGSDGVHEPIDWSPYEEIVEKFKEEHVISYIVSQEKTERVMFNWLRTLQFHNFDQPRLEGPQKPWVKLIKMMSEKSPEQKECLDSDAQPITDVLNSDARPITDVLNSGAQPATGVFESNATDSPSHVANESNADDQINVIRNSLAHSSDQGTLDSSRQVDIVSSNHDNLISSKQDNLGSNQDSLISSNQDSLVSSNQDSRVSSNQDNHGSHQDSLISSNRDNHVSSNQDSLGSNQDSLISSHQDSLVSSNQDNHVSSNQDCLVCSVDTEPAAIIGSSTGENYQDQLPAGDAADSCTSTSGAVDDKKIVAQSQS